jgi:hypothetical protein
VGVAEGGSVFGPHQTYGSGSQPHSIYAGDLDDDGDIDLVFGNDGPNTVWFNDGDGIFTDSGQLLGTSGSSHVALADFDLDGDLDAFVANWYDHPDRVWLNNGSGVFSDSGQSLGATSSYEVSLGDVDGDGDLDAFVGENAGGSAIWING